MTSKPGTERGPETGLNGDSDALSIDRAISELRRGRFIGIVEGPRALVVTALETATPAAIDRLRQWSADAALLLTPERAIVLRADSVGPVRIALDDDVSLDTLKNMAGLTSAVGESTPMAARGAVPWPGSQALLAAGFRLAKAARLLPALIGTETPASGLDRSLAPIELTSVERFTGAAIPTLKRVSESRVPLADAEDSTVTLFRDLHGGTEHIAVTIGSPDRNTSVPVRLHSACLTGDVLGSLRCDCGEQLRSAVRRIAALGGGILLYLDQEGRGIGLANKLRAYTIQDAGLDTLDADRHLGFRTDERTYGAAAAMLAQLGIERVQLLTNNPQKISAISDLGIDVTGRLPLVAASNVHNERYLRAKRERAGHLSEETGS